MKGCHVVLSRTVLISVGLLLLISLGILLVSCDEVKHRDVLTFFFDGVESTGPDGFEDGSFDPNDRLAQADQASVWYVHEPTRDRTLCWTLCHTRRGKRRTSIQSFLLAPVPQLCFKCHTDDTASAAFVHGPVAVGQCLFCHDHHRSRVKHLLKHPEPDLCYVCHDADAIAAIPPHSAGQPSVCTDCHNPHSSSVKALLKDAALLRVPEHDGAETLDKVVQQYVRDARPQDQKKSLQPSQTTQTAASDSDNLFQILRTVSKLLEQGQLQQARAYLEEFKDNAAFTDQEREKIAQVLSLMDSATRGAAGSKAEKPAKRKKPPAEPEKDDLQLRKKMQENADLFYLSMDLYREGKLVRARTGFASVLKSGLIPAPMDKTIRDYLKDIDKRLAEEATPPD